MNKSLISNFGKIKGLKSGSRIKTLSNLWNYFTKSDTQIQKAKSEMTNASAPPQSGGYASRKFSSPIFWFRAPPSQKNSNKEKGDFVSAFCPIGQAEAVLYSAGASQKIVLTRGYIIRWIRYFWFGNIPHRMAIAFYIPCSIWISNDQAIALYSHLNRIDLVKLLCFVVYTFIINAK